MSEEQYVYFIDNTIQHEVLNAEACIEAIEKGYRAWGKDTLRSIPRQSSTSIGTMATTISA